MHKNKFIDQIFLVAILGAVFVLVTAILDAFIGMPEISYLLFHSIWFQVGLIASLWLVAILIMKFLQNDNK